jgi:hypothetical protein
MRRALRDGWIAAKSNYKLLLSASFISVTVPMIMAVLPFGISIGALKLGQLGAVWSWIPSELFSGLIVAAVIFMTLAPKLLLYLSLTFLGLGCINIARKLFRSEPTNIGSLFLPLNTFVRAVIADAVRYAILFVSVITLAFLSTGQSWTVALGVILLGITAAAIFEVRLSFFQWIIVDHDVGPIRALKDSAALTRGAFWPLLGFYILHSAIYIPFLSLGLLQNELALLSVLSLAVVLLFPWILASTAAAYTQLCDPESTAQVASEESMEVSTPH